VLIKFDIQMYGQSPHLLFGAGHHFGKALSFLGNELAKLRVESSPQNGPDQVIDVRILRRGLQTAYKPLRLKFITTLKRQPPERP
jgi:hypothetical protein